MVARRARSCPRWRIPTQSCSPMTPFVMLSLDLACKITPPTGSHKGPSPTSTSSPAPTIHGLGEPIRRIVGASRERMWGLRPSWSPVRTHHRLSSPSLKCIGDNPCPYYATVPAPICGATRSVEEIAVCEQAWYPVWVSGQITLINRRGDFNGRTDWSR